MPGTNSYNPLAKENLGKSVGGELLSRDIVGLEEIKKFHGAGIYAIYYAGAFASYRNIRMALPSDGSEVPIYVGKAVPAGSRKGGFGLDADPGYVLSSRLREHRDSIRATNNISSSEFYCRYLVVDDIWIPLGESLLIARYSPVWNKIVDGFGNHDPGKGRYGQEISRWDSLHPGRSWALKCKERSEAVEEIATDIETHLRMFRSD